MDDNASIGHKRFARLQANSFSQLLRHESAGNISYMIRTVSFVIHLSQKTIHYEVPNVRDMYVELFCGTTLAAGP
jgi:hypothetical protein